MSWTPTLNLGVSVKSGTTESTAGTITFNTAFPDANYVVILTPYVTGANDGPAQAWVIGPLTSGSFTFDSTGANGVYWMATYSNS